MGCCVSTHKHKTVPKDLAHQNNHPPHSIPCVSKSPPRAEEEAVKEVLSETPNPKPEFRPDSPAQKEEKQPTNPKPDSPAREEEEQPTKPKLVLLTPKKPSSNPKLPARNPDPCTPEETSEVSEMCSLSESIVSTNTLKEDDDNHLLCTKETASSGESRQRVCRSQGYTSNYSSKYNLKNNQGRLSARRRPEPSPTRRKIPGQGGPRREMGGDNSTRRSQSPRVRADMGRSPSVRRNGSSPGRARMVHGPEDRVKMEVNEEEEIGLKRDSEEWQGPKESLENPLVSLECFIFL